VLQGVGVPLRLLHEGALACRLALRIQSTALTPLCAAPPGEGHVVTVRLARLARVNNRPVATRLTACIAFRFWQVELKTGETYRGTLVESEDNWNSQMKDITVTGRVRAFRHNEPACGLGFAACLAHALASKRPRGNAVGTRWCDRAVHRTVACPSLRTSSSAAARSGAHARTGMRARWPRAAALRLTRVPATPRYILLPDMLKNAPVRGWHTVQPVMC
jgi:small nuclear ribonucleoprotein (snRNP)-like protein